MKRTLKTKIIIIILVFCWTKAGIAAESDVVLRLAPVIMQQKFSQNTISRENVFTRFNFDNDWRLNNNSINLAYHKMELVVYYSLVESDKHYYIGYYLYYPRHDGTIKHEHDLIGALIAVRKPNIVENIDSIDMMLTFSNGKLRNWGSCQVNHGTQWLHLLISTGAHEMLSFRPVEINKTVGCIYPQPYDAPHNVSNEDAQTYTLVSLEELWQRRGDIGKGHTFDRWGYFDGYYFSNVAAPWLWQYRQNNWLVRPFELMQCLRGSRLENENYIENQYH